MKLKTYLYIAATITSLLYPATLFAVTSTASLRVSVTILPWLKLNTEQLINSYQVTSDDLQRGYVDLPGSAVVNIRTNERKPIAINATSEWGQTILIRESGAGSFPAAAGSLEIGRPQPGVAMIKKLDYRIILPEGAKEGRFALNVTIASQSY